MILTNLSVKNYFLLLFLIHTFFITSKSEQFLYMKHLVMFFTYSIIFLPRSLAFL